MDMDHSPAVPSQSKEQADFLPSFFPSVRVFMEVLEVLVAAPCSSGYLQRSGIQITFGEKQSHNHCDSVDTSLKRAD